MNSFFDCRGRLACKGDPETGLVECWYKKHMTSAILQIGESFKVEREDTITIITRASANTFTVESRIIT